MEMEMPSTPAEPSQQAATGAGGARPNGPVAAAVLATGIGALVLGVLTVLSEASGADMHRLAAIVGVSALLAPSAWWDGIAQNVLFHPWRQPSTS